MRATAGNKRKPSPDAAESTRNGCHIKRRGSTINVETRIRASNESHDQPASNRFEIFPSSSRTLRKRKRRKSSNTDGHRSWVYSARDCSTFTDKIIIASYNILGVENASKHPDLYHRVPSKFLEWNFRKELICKAIKFYKAGILCLQEVDRFNDLNELFQSYGYKGVYKSRTGEINDGCAVFWIEKQFTLLHQESIEFQSFGLRNNVAQLCVFKMNQTKSNPQNSSRCLVVGNIHVLFNPNRGDIKLGQVRLFLDKAHKLSQKWGNIPVIMAGDLNSIPKSALYQFLSSSELNIQLHDRRRISGQIDFSSREAFRSRSECSKWSQVSISGSFSWSDEEIKIASGSENVTCLQHQLKLSSAYHEVPGSCKTRDANGEPLATSFHSKFMGTVDYIWHSEELVPVRVLETLPIDILKRTGGLPNEKWGSDHLALVCELAFDDGKET